MLGLNQGLGGLGSDKPMDACFAHELGFVAWLTQGSLK